MHAAEEGHMDIIKLFVENKADLDAKTGSGKELGEMRKDLRGEDGCGYQGSILMGK